MAATAPALVEQALRALMPALVPPPPGEGPGELPLAGRNAVTQELAPLEPGEIERLAAVQPDKREAFEAGAATWQQWNCALYTSTTSLTNLNAAWLNWNVTYSNATGSYVYDTASNTAMVINSGSTLTVLSPQWTSWNTSYEETAGEQAEREVARAERERLWEEQRADREREAAERRREAEAATARSLGLLRSLLSDEQWASYQDDGWFEVRGRSGRRWRVRNRGQSGNVDLMPEIGEERDATYCAHPPGGLPAADAHAAQMLALVTDDEAFLRVAVEHWRRPGAERRAFMRAVA